MRSSSRGGGGDIGEAGNRLAAFVDHLRHRHKDAFERLVERVKHYYPPLVALSTRRYGPGWATISVTERWGKEEATFNARQVSDGLLRLVAIAALYELNPPPSVVLFDEIENGLCEGPSDIGHFASRRRRCTKRRHAAGAGRRSQAPGWCRRSSGGSRRNRGLAIRLEGQKITHLPKQRTRRKNAERAIDARLHGAIALARAKDARLVVFLADADTRDHAAMMEPILAALPSDDDAAPAVLVGLPKAMIEAWALGDPDAIAALAGDDGKKVPRWPERLWGDKHNPRSDFPKHVLKRCLGHDYTSEELASIGEQADLDVMAKRCPESFAPFLERARAIAATCANGTE